MPAYIDHALSFARMNSVIVRNGTRPTAITVAPSSRRGPSSPAMRISILMFESATCIAIAEAKHPRRLEGSVVGISRANWSFVNDSHGRGALGSCPCLPIAPGRGDYRKVLVPCASLAYTTKGMNRPTFNYAADFLRRHHQYSTYMGL